MTDEPRSLGREGVLALVGVNLLVFMATLDMSIVNVSLPTLQKVLNTDFATIQWVVVSYVLVLTCLMLLVSRVGDMAGKKQVFTLGIVLFTAASLLCGLAPDVHSLIIFRGLQGIGAAMSQGLGIGIVTEIAPPHMRGRAIGIVGTTVAIGLAAGPPIGGLLIELVGWRFIFLLNVPLGLFAWRFVRRYVPHLPPAQKGQRFDWWGGAITFAALGCYCLGMTWGQDRGFASPVVLVLLGAAVAGLVLFLRVERRVAQPMIDLTIFRNALLSLNLLMGVVLFIAGAMQFILPFYLQYVQGYGAGQVGLLIGTIPVGMGLVSFTAGSLTDRFGARGVTIVGLAIATAGFAGMSTLTQATPWWGFVARTLPIGIGFGLFLAPNNTAIMSAAPRERLGVVSGLLNYTRVFGQTTGVPLIGSIFTGFVLLREALPDRTGFTEASAGSLVFAVQNTYLVTTGLMLVNLGLAVAAFLLEKRRAGPRPAPEL
jgi:EmrB/QacA subfamily drug resistance transporter